MGVGRRHERRHGEHGGDAERHACRRRVPVEPKRHPRDDDDQTGRDVDLDQVVAHGAHELDVAGEPRVIACSRENGYELRRSTSSPSLLHAHTLLYNMLLGIIRQA